MIVEESELLSSKPLGSSVLLLFYLSCWSTRASSHTWMGIMTNTSATSSPLALTASWTAAVRAMESQREDRLFDDPWAKDLAGESGMSWIKDKSPESVVISDN